jgi:ABC-type polysaccharide/polyol phosphate export permease
MQNSSFFDFIFESLKNLNRVYHISTLDISLKYRRTILGNIWIVLTYLITISIISFVWSFVLNASIKDYFPKLFIGFTTFYLILSFTSQSYDILYQKYQGIILSLGIKINEVILRHLIFIILEYLQFLPFYFIIIFLAGIGISLNTFLFFPGLLLVIINGYWMLFLSSLICARFRDLGLLLSAIMSTGILLTPILWDKERLGVYENYVYLNPFTSMIEAVRDPLMGTTVNPIVYYLLITYIVIGYSICSIFYKKKYKVFNFWL